jgi:energy-coupling factor transporter ATP-binding protein EcfA2
LFDEPFSGLDGRSAAALAERLRGLRGDGRTLVFVTHEIRWAGEVASAALVLGAGRVADSQAGPELDAHSLEAAYAAAAP